MTSPGAYERMPKGGKESAARSANLGGCKGRAANEDRRQTKRTRMGCGALKERKKGKIAEPRDGWQMANPTGQKVIYVKGNG